MTSRRGALAALGGILGPAAFIAAWATLPRWHERYSAVGDPISRLAAVDSPTRVAMTAGLLSFGIGVGAYSTRLRTALPGPAAIAAATTAVASAGVAATPLGSALGGSAHAACAGLSYASLAALPLFGARTFARQGRPRIAVASAAAGVASAASLLASVMSPEWTGLFQRLGLTLGDVWIIATAGWMLAHPQAETPAPPGRA